MTRPSPNSVANFYNEFNQQLLRDYVVGNARVDRAIKRTLQYIDEGTSNLLDIGCGAGQLAAEFASRRSHLSVHGVDISPTNISVAEQLFSLPNLSFSVSDLTTLPEQRPFDVITLIDVYEHIPRDEWPEFNVKLKKCLSENGTIVLTTPTAQHQNHLAKHQPEKLQIIDETVEIVDLLQLSRDTGTTPILYEQVSVWRNRDYAHFAATNVKDNFQRLTTSRSRWHKVIEAPQRLRRWIDRNQRRRLLRSKLGQSV